jgi:serine protease AprX
MRAVFAGTCAAAVIALGVGTGTAYAAGPADPSPTVPAPVSAAARVVVRYEPARPGPAQAAVTRLGGRVAGTLATVDDLVATVPADAVDDLRATPGVVAVTADAPVGLKGRLWNPDDSQATSMADIATGTGAADFWGQKDASGRPITGKGVGVALIDSGVAPVEGLTGAGKVVNGPDLSFESQAPNLRYLDTFGHGTHMAGIIAGRDASVKPGKERDGVGFVGMAPDATLVNLKVAAADGAVDVSQVIAAIDWVVAHRNDPGLNIRVLNLSFGTDSVQDERLDPLSHAVEAAWRNGIVVVVAAGNDGPSASRLSMPAANPYVIAVGGADSVGTDARGDDVVAGFSTRGNAARHPDLVAPARSVMSLRDPGAFVDVNYPTGQVPGDTAQRFFRGSGTSQATAVVSGAAALLLQQRPNLTPDQVKRLLTSTAAPMPKADPIGRGAGQLDLRAASHAGTPVAATQNYPASLGTGSLDQSRGTAHVADPDTAVTLTGEQDIMGHAWNASTWSAAASAGTAWTGGTWNGNVWTGDACTGSSWASRTWSSVDWTSRTWSSRTWSGMTWSGAVWDGHAWTSRTWSSRTWSSRTWSGDYWSSADWA